MLCRSPSIPRDIPILVTFTMHRALQIEEILLNIFSYCCTPARPQYSRPRTMRYRYANSHLVALGSTCKTFKELALDMIWADLNDLTPLVRCLSKTLWVESEGVYSLKRCLERNDWNTILGYARRVRALPRMYRSFGLDEDCIKALSNPPISVESIFPNLRVLGLYIPNATTVPLLRHFIHPKLTNIWLERLGNLGGIAEALGERCPLVTDFRVREWDYADTSGLICRWQNLRSVTCHGVGFNADALFHLARSRNLRSMSFKVQDAMVDQICATEFSMLTFPALHTIHLTSNSLTPIWRFLRHVRSPIVRSLSVVQHTRPTESDLMSFSVALREVCAHDSLKKLSLRTSNESNNTASHHAPPYNVTFDRLRPLTVFMNIRSITLDVRCGTDLNERELLCLASSWPCLKHFEVGEDYDWTASSAITPGGFVQLLGKCRSLKVFYFMFDTRGFTQIPQGHPWRGLAAPQGMFIHVLNSPIEEESIEALGVFFHVAPYPDFTLTTHWNNHYFRGSERPRELCDLYYDRWVRARSRAFDLWRERRNLRHFLEVNVHPPV